MNNTSTWIVYRHICPDGRKYIGITSQKPENRWVNGLGYHSNYRFWDYICRVGWDKIIHEIVCVTSSLQEARLIEDLLIKAENTLWPNGFNQKMGEHIFDEATIDNDEARIEMIVSGLWSLACFGKVNEQSEDAVNAADGKGTQRSRSFTELSSGDMDRIEKEVGYIFVCGKNYAEKRREKEKRQRRRAS